MQHKRKRISKKIKKKKEKKERNALRAKIKTSFCDITFIGNVIFFQYLKILVFYFNLIYAYGETKSTW